MTVRPLIDSNSDIPLYRQLYQQFTDFIEAGKLLPGERLPATRELAGLLGLNRQTVAAAYELLETEGLIAGQVGRGSFVATRPGRLNWAPLVKTSEPKRVFPPAAISFSSSRPSERLFPLDEFRASCMEVLAARTLTGVMQLGAPAGYEPLRQYLLENARKEGTCQDTDDLLITNGCQQALDLIRRALIRDDDKVGLEDPVYPGLRSAFADSKLIGLPVRGDGIDRELLSQAQPKLLAITPNFQNPTGTTLSLEARESILSMAYNAGSVVVENDIYGDLRYEGERVPTLKELDGRGHVVLLRSFSKVAFPGLRVGWVIAPKPLIEALTELKQSTDLHTDQFSQAVLLRFALSGRLWEHREQMVFFGAERLRAVLAACQRHLPEGSRYTRPQGGMNLWVTLPDGLNTTELLQRAQDAGVSYLPGNYFSVSEPHPSALRLSFAGLTPEQIETGVGLLGGIFKNELENRRKAEKHPTLALV